MVRLWRTPPSTWTVGLELHPGTTAVTEATAGELRAISSLVTSTSAMTPSMIATRAGWDSPAVVHQHDADHPRPDVPHIRPAKRGGRAVSRTVPARPTGLSVRAGERRCHLLAWGGRVNNSTCPKAWLSSITSSHDGDPGGVGHRTGGGRPRVVQHVEQPSRRGDEVADTGLGNRVDQDIGLRDSSGNRVVEQQRRDPRPSFAAARHGGAGVVPT